jgi:glycosyltransferase involved in cell wall biosynthesis
MRVVILHNDLRVYWKGRIKFLNHFLAKHDISLYVIELFGKGSPYAFDQVDKANCLFPNNSYDELSKAEIKNKLFARLDEINPDVVIGGSIVFFSGALGVAWSRKHNKHFIMFDDGKPSDIKRNALVQFIKDIITRQADALWLPSPDYDVEYKSLFKHPWYFHGYNTIDNTLFKTDGQKTLDHNVIICVARLVEIKNFDNLLKAWKQVEANNNVYRLRIIGAGYEEEKLKKLTTDLGLQRVEFIGFVPNIEIPQYLFNADAFVLASFAESWGLAVNEAMAAGLPIILSKNINAHTALLNEDENGYLFDPNNADQIAEKMLKFINLEPAVKQAMSQKSLEIIGTMDYENMGQELLAVLNKMLKLQPKKATFMGDILMNIWRGGYNTSTWDKQKKLSE